MLGKAKAKDKKILVVEDEDALRQILLEEFRDEGFQTCEARNGAEGLEMAQKESPDLILLDIVMPKMDGMKMLKNMREKRWGKGIPVMLLTNLDNDAGKTLEAAQYGVYEFLVKSRWKLKEVMKRIKEKLSVA
ncbi:MAG: response regulator [Candidatus Harrisonbacteria bacterium CG10_big_fil_rev_8_21_14_0_10_44_23]|uniref:Response regulator n=1 Tax=Candidatus Harrisonbacteria bacterium CG10_big_fil_rev_8_21_14_0_10_44_23 TaxID=1974585 RepID=A0A2H0UT48_9BACT|nr:MAG: response regulator [Candidatus Harrisonbacteria bacterium CG10_big_fil_rev_8_21_14_0_10_44_23]